MDTESEKLLGTLLGAALLRTGKGEAVFTAKELDLYHLRLRCEPKAGGRWKVWLVTKS